MLVKMMPSMPLLMTPIKKNTDASRDSQNTVPTELTKDIFVNIAETEQYQTLMLFSPNAVPQGSNTTLPSTFSPSSTEVSSITNKKHVSPRQVKKTTLHRAIEITGKKENQIISSLQSLLIPVNHSITMDTEMKSSTSTTAVGQDVEMTEVGVVPDIEKLNVDVGVPAENHSLSSPQQHHKVDVKEGSVKGKTPSSMSARRSKKQRELEATIAALKPETAQMKEDRATSYAHTYFMKVKELLEDAAYAEFVQELVNFKDNNNMDAASLYTRMTTLLSPHKDLIDEFLAFLLPDQAKQVGRLMDYILLVKMKDFLIKLEVLLTKQSQQVYTSLEQLASQPNVSLTDVHNAILPHLKSSPLLTDYFLELLPRERAPDSLMIDYEQADCIEGDEDICYEMIQVPDCEDPYGGEHCPCKCHETQGFHCITCGIKYINGRVYLQHGKIIRSAKVTFEKEDQEKMLKLKWRERGEPEIGYSRYHRRRCFPTPVKASDHRESTKKSPRTPRAKTVNGSKPRNYKSASKGSCSTKGLPLIEGIMPLSNKLEFHNSAETEIRNGSEIEKEIKFFGGNEISVDEQLKNVQVGDDQQCLIQNSPKEIVRLTQGLIEAVQDDSDSVDADVMMSIEEEETKSPTCSQIAEIPSIISPMSFYSESLHSESGFELINKYTTNISRYEDTVLQPSSPLTLLNPKSPLLQTNEKSEKEIETIQDTDIEIFINNDNSTNLCSKGIGLVSRVTMESICSEKMCFSDIKESQIGNELILKKDVDYTIESHRLSFVDSDTKAIVNIRKHEGEIISEPRDESMTECGSNSEHVFCHVDMETNEESTSGNETLNDGANLNLGKKSNMDREVKLHSCSFLSTEQKKQESILKIESRKSSIVIEEKNDIVSSESKVSDQKKTNTDCASHSSIVTEQKKAMTTPELPCWTREEDKIILQAFQQEGDSEQTFIKINLLLPTRTVREIQNRFQVLLQLLQQMTGVAEDSGR